MPPLTPIPSPHGPSLESPADISTEFIRDTLRDAIVDRRLTPGTKLTEKDVGELFKVSRTLVRGALQALSYEGLVSVEKNRGAFVAYPSPLEARQIFATRRILEPGILTAAAPNIGPIQIATLRRMLIEENRLTGERGASARRAEIKASGDFHLMIASFTHNPVMQRFMDELVGRSSLVIALYGQSTISSCGHQEHQDIVTAIETGDLATATHRMIHHIDHIEADLDLREKKAANLQQALSLTL